jgi:hypothetical protein
MLSNLKRKYLEIGVIIIVTIFIITTLSIFLYKYYQDIEAPSENSSAFLLDTRYAR